MNRNRLPPIVWVISIILLVAGCAAPTPSPVAEAPQATAIPTPAPPAPTPQPVLQQAKVTIGDFTLNSQALAGNLLGDATERPVSVILPPGYADSQKRYPVVYYLHGGDVDAETQALYLLQSMFREMWLGTENATGDFIAGVQQAMQRGEIQEMILVFPNAGNNLTGSWYLSSPTNGDYETYLTQELVDYVDSHYRTLAQRASRGIAGCSMGADGAAHLGLKYPDVYAVVVPQ
jgi:S-formylglutathione hydrolase FrmB